MKGNEYKTARCHLGKSEPCGYRSHWHKVPVDVRVDGRGQERTVTIPPSWGGTEVNFVIHKDTWRYFEQERGIIRFYFW